MASIISAGFAGIILIVMLIFGLFTRKNLIWVAISMVWGAALYGIAYLISPKALELGLNSQVLNIFLLPALQQILACLGVLLIVHWQKFDNLVDGAVYGFASGLGYAISKSIEMSGGELEKAALTVISTSLVLGTASGIVGVLTSQFYFQPLPRKYGLLFSGLAVGIIYTAIFNYLFTRAIGGNVLPIAFGIGGITLVGLYLMGQLRSVITRLAVEKSRADGLLDIVIPIGVNLTHEKDFQKLLEAVLVEAMAFCHADAGALYLRKEDLLECAVVRNETLNINMGGTSGIPVTHAPIQLYNSVSKKPNHHLVEADVALRGKTVNIPDSYKDVEYDFSDVETFDEQNRYASVSFLFIPLKNNAGDVLGVLELLNAQDAKRKVLVPFDSNLQQLMESFSSLAAAALEGYLQEQSLRKEIQELRIQIDAVKRKKQVDEITNSDYFKDLKQRTQDLKEKKSDQ
jgi:GAF domain-containing protein